MREGAEARFGEQWAMLSNMLYGFFRDTIAIRKIEPPDQCAMLNESRESKNSKPFKLPFGQEK